MSKMQQLLWTVVTAAMGFNSQYAMYKKYHKSHGDHELNGK